MPLNRKKMTSLKLGENEKIICKVADGKEIEYLSYPGDLLLAAIPDTEQPPAGWTLLAWGKEIT